jgi:hypothetical protein
MKIADNLRLCPSHVTAAKVSATLPFVIPSELRICYTRHSSTATYAAFFKESRMILTENSKFGRKSGGSQGPAVRLSRPKTSHGNIFRQSGPGFPASRYRPRLRMRLSESRTKFANAAKLDKKSGERKGEPALSEVEGDL